MLERSHIGIYTFPRKPLIPLPLHNVTEISLIKATAVVTSTSVLLSNPWQPLGLDSPRVAVWHRTPLPRERIEYAPILRMADHLLSKYPSPNYQTRRGEKLVCRVPVP